MKRLDCLDALRGGAAMLVVVQHVLERVQPDARVLDYCNLGTLGVLLFFLISGFVVPFSIKGERPLERFAISRMARLLPALWLSVAAMVMLHGADLPTILANMAMLAPPLGLPRLTDVYWTLTYELVFYGIAALMFAGGVLKSPRVAGTFVLCCLVLVKAEEGRLLFLAYMMLGLLLRLDVLERDPAARPWAIVCTLATLAVGAHDGWGGNSGLAELDGWPRLTGNVLPLVAFLGTILWRPQPGRALVYLGSISYSVYLFQDAVIDVALLAWPRPGLAFALAVVAGVLVLATMIYEWVEKPFMALGRRLANRLSAPQAQAA